MLSVTVIISAVMSWFPVNPYARIPALIRDTVAPLLDPLRRVIPRVGSIDFSALAAIILLNLVPFLVSTIVQRLF
jgi:YggT family protein